MTWEGGVFFYFDYCNVKNKIVVTILTYIDVLVLAYIQTHGVLSVLLSMLQLFEPASTHHYQVLTHRQTYRQADTHTHNHPLPRE